MGQSYWKNHQSKLSKTAPSVDTLVSMTNKNIEDTDIIPLFKDKSEDLAQLILRFNLITAEGMLHFSTLSWSNLTTLYLSNNSITSRGCQYLARTHIQNIMKISLKASNFITQTGLSHLCKASWNNLTELALTLNYISNVYWVSKGKWPRIAQIYFTKNIISAEGGIVVVLMNAYHLKCFFLSSNKLSERERTIVRRQVTTKFQNLSLNI